MSCWPLHRAEFRLKQMIICHWSPLDRLNRGFLLVENYKK